jgi:aryl-alcohol dehydrogenase-like predicted oxidoreductase
MTSSPEHADAITPAPGHRQRAQLADRIKRHGPLERRTLGWGGPAVSAIGLGCMGMTGFYGGPDEAESIRTLRRALELGCNFWDTSDAYGPHTNERLLARVLGSHRGQVFVATKFGISIDPRTLRRSVDGSPATARRSCDASLRRLGVDHIDLYYPHRVDPATPIEETVGAMAELVREGKVRYIGLSEPGVDTIRRAHTVHPIIAVQTEYSLWTRDIEADILPVLRELGIGLVAYAPLGHGFLTGAYRNPQNLAEGDFRRSQPRFADQNIAHNLQLVDRVGQLAAEKGIIPAQLAIAWVLHQGHDIAPIAGTKRVQYLEQDLAGADVRLSPEELTRINDTIAEPAGDRYDPAGMRTVRI